MLIDKLVCQVIDGVIVGEGDFQQVVDGCGLVVVFDDVVLGFVVDDVIVVNLQIVEKICGGKVQVVGVFIGQIMKVMKGQVDVKWVREFILEKLF